MRSSLDLMIKEKVGELGGVQKEAQRTKRPTTNKEELIFKLKEKANEEEDISVILEILDNLDWGEGKELTNITELIQGHLHFPIELSKVNRSINTLLKNSNLSFLYEKPNPLENLSHLLSSYLFVSEIFQRNSDFINKWSVSFQVDQEVFIDTLHYCILKSEGYEIAKIYDYIIQGKSPLHKVDDQKRRDILINYSFMKGTNHPKQVETIIHEVKNESPVIQCLRPLPMMKDKKDLETALNIFKQRPDSIDLKKVKKTYRELLSKAHPDRISSLGLKEEYVKIAHSNFITIQNAYDLLKLKGK